MRPNTSLVCLLAAAGSATAQCQVASLLPPDSPPTHAGFASALGMRGTTLAVGARSMPSTTSIRGGAVFVYERNSGGQWVLDQKIISNGIAEGDEFGVSAAIRGDRLIVGAWLDDDAASGAGAAYVFTKTPTGWEEDDKLIAGDAMPGDRLGVSVALDGDFAVAGAPYTAQTGLQTGTAYIFEREAGPGGWIQRARLERPTNQPGALFGSFVAIQGDVAMIAAPGDSFGGLSRGAVYVFARNGLNWDFQQRLQSDDAADMDGFGIAISLSGDSVLIGAYAAGVTHQGAAYVFRNGRGGWVQEAKLTASDAAGNDFFGSGVALDGDVAVIGAPQADLPGGADQGAGYLFQRTGTAWAQVEKVSASNAGPMDGYGTSAALGGGFAAIGSMANDQANTDAGSAAVFGVAACECYPNCDETTIVPRLNVADFICYLTRYAAGDPYANCDGSTIEPTLNVADFICYLTRFAAGCD